MLVSSNQGECWHACLRLVPCSEGTFRAAKAQRPSLAVFRPPLCLATAPGARHHTDLSSEMVREKASWQAHDGCR